MGMSPPWPLNPTLSSPDRLEENGESASQFEQQIPADRAQRGRGRGGGSYQLPHSLTSNIHDYFLKVAASVPLQHPPQVRVIIFGTLPRSDLVTSDNKRPKKRVSRATRDTSPTILVPSSFQSQRSAR